MGVLRAGFHGTVGQSSAQVIDGSLKFDNDSSQYLSKTFSSAGNRDVWTWSSWVRRSNSTEQCAIFSAYNASNNANYGMIWLNNDGTFNFQNWDGGSNSATTNALLRDTGWYHLVVLHDESASPKAKFYVNGTLQTLASNLSTSQGISGNWEHRIGMEVYNSRKPYDGSMSQVYFIDGQALTPESFGYTDPLTNTWRPKKFSDFPTPVADTQLLYNVNTSDNGFDSSSTSRTYDAASRTFATYTTPQSANQGGVGANAAHVYKSPTGSAITWVVSTDTTDRYIWTSSNGVDWSSSGSYYDTDSSPQSVTSVYIALAAGSNASNVTVTSSTSGIGQVGSGVNSFYLPMDGNSPIGDDKSGAGNNWTPVNFGGSVALDNPIVSGALPILNTDGGGNVARPGTRTDPYASSIVMAIPFLGNANDISADIKGSGSNLSVTTSGSPAADSDPVQWYGSSFNVSTNNYINTIGTTSTFAFLHQPEVAGTIEGWINTNAINVQGPWFQTSNGTNEIGVMFRQNSSTNLAVQINRGTSGNYIVIDSSITIALNTWYHWAFVKSADGYAQFFLNGVATGNKVAISAAAGASNPASTSATSNNEGRIAKNNGEARGIGANICDYRAYTVQKYAFDTSFIPASTNPDILPDTPSGVSGSSKLAKVTDGAVSFDGSGDYLTVADSTDFDHQSTFTWDCFVYLHAYDSSGAMIIDQGDGSSYGVELMIDTSGNIRFYQNNSTVLVGPSGGFTLKRWHHIAVSHDGTKIRLFLDGIKIGENTTSSVPANVSTALNIGKYSGNSNYEVNGFISNLRFVNGTALYTTDFTPPTRELTDVTNTKLLCCQSNTSAGAATVSPNLGGINDGTVWSDFLSTAAAFGGTHVRVRAFDGNTSTMAATASNTGYAVTGNDTNALEFIPPSPIAYSSSIKVRGRNTGQTTMGVKIDTGSGYGSEIALSGDDLQTVVSGSGNLVKIKVYTKTYSGENELGGIAIDDVYLTDPVTVYGDAAATTFNPFTTDINAVRGQETGYATLNPLASKATLSSGNLTATQSGTSNTWYPVATTVFVSSGKWYCEYTIISLTGDAAIHLGIASPTWSIANGSYVGNDAGSYGYRSIPLSNGAQSAGSKYNSGSSSTYGAKFGDGYIVGVAFDADRGTLEFYNNGISQGVAFTGITGEKCMAASVNTNSGVSQVTANFGQKPFKFPPPAGFQPLNAANVRPETVITRPDQYVGVNIWSGNGGTQSINAGLKPDVVWIKSRTSADSHHLYDTIRGTARLAPANPNAEYDNSDFGSFDASGFTVINGKNQTNGSGKSYVAWTWRAGGNKNTFNVDDVGYASAAAAGLDGGTLNPTGASVGTKQGFAIIKADPNQSAATISHGLGRKPAFIISKPIDSSSLDWNIFHQSLGTSELLRFTTAGDQTVSGYWGSAMTTTTFGVAAGNNGNNQDNPIYYVWADVPGLQKFGSYIGNGDPDGPFVETGMRPALVVFKKSSASGDPWLVYDGTRNTFNLATNRLFWNSDNEELSSTDYAIDILSNGFKIRTSDTSWNASGATFIYAAWAEAPAFNLYGAQSNAR